MKIGGNINALLQVKSSVSTNEIGEKVPTWATLIELIGWLDESGQSTNSNDYLTKKEESTHFFICDYFEITKDIKKVENKRMLIDDEVYQVLLIDDPMNLHNHIEIYLKYVGGQ